MFGVNTGSDELMQAFLQNLRQSKRRLGLRLNNFVANYKWRVSREISHQRRLFHYRATVFRANKCFHNRDGRRFLELHGLLTEFLKKQIKNNPDRARLIAGQLDNVLRNCDQITYEEPGTAEAYALLHFLDRYHRFQLIFDSLHKQKLLPWRGVEINILDVGTGPGPSMYAVSDYYSTILKKDVTCDVNGGRLPFSIDYVEKSQEFRNWLHHFTEFVNYDCPTKNPWQVPFHHGSFSDFANLEFNQPKIKWDQDDDGDQVAKIYIKKHRFDIIVFSNFLTTKEQVAGFSKEIENCARFLRNNGILLIVGARGFTNKYREVYDSISETIVSGGYSNRKMVASCKKVDIRDSIMSYSWRDCYGERLKQLIRVVYDVFEPDAKDSIPDKTFDLLRRTMQAEYSKAIEWEILVFQKKARPRYNKK